MLFSTIQSFLLQKISDLAVEPDYFSISPYEDPMLPGVRTYMHVISVGKHSYIVSGFYEEALLNAYTNICSKIMAESMVREKSANT